MEFDGPSHFMKATTQYWNTKIEQSGSTIMKHNHLRLLGYSVVSVPYWEWAKLYMKEREGYLQGKLAEQDPRFLRKRYYVGNDTSRVVKRSSKFVDIAYTLLRERKDIVRRVRCFILG